MKKILAYCCIGLAVSFCPAESFAQFIQEKAVDSTNNAEVEDQRMLLKILDAKSNKPVEADLIIKGLNPRKPVVFSHISDTTLLLKNYRLYTVSAVKEGYMYFAHKFWPDESSEHRETIRLQPLAIGLKTNVQDITFLGDETEVYHKSVPALEELVQFLKINPSVKLMIIGHANGPASEKKNANYYKKGSEKRAESVRDYLIQHGIMPERLATKGAGNTQMVYPDPKTDWETQANRRIEIEIIGL
ncbi:MAG: OmpA family protein [Crocinitomicaceae bacterium]|nr:OmpA family protein [Crocinitomicaceae bacterium]